MQIHVCKCKRNYGNKYIANNIEGKDQGKKRQREEIMHEFHVHVQNETYSILSVIATSLRSLQEPIISMDIWRRHSQ